MNVFDIIGPVMIGPSSSHTAGATRLGKITRILLGEEPVKANIQLHGSFARTYKGHGTDKAIIGGLLGYLPDDLRIRNSLETAQKLGLEFHLKPVDLGDVHPNTAAIEVTGKSGKTLQLVGSSIGGGKVLIRKVNDLEVEFTAEYYTLIIPHQDAPGVVAAVTDVLSKNAINIAQMKVYRKHRRGRAMILIETDQPVDPNIREVIERLPRITSVTFVEPI